LGGYRPTVPAGDFVFGVVNQKRKPRGVGAGVDIFLTSENIERLQPLALCPFLWNFPEFSLPHNLRAPVLERKLCRKAFVGGIDVDSDNGRLAFGDSGNEGVELGWVKRTNASKNVSVILIIDINDDHGTVGGNSVDAKLGVRNDAFDTVKHTGVAEYPGQQEECRDDWQRPNKASCETDAMNGQGLRRFTFHVGAGRVNCHWADPEWCKFKYSRNAR
jgi:hypothetical protein